MFLGTVMLRAAYRLIHFPGIWQDRFPLYGDKGDKMVHLILVNKTRENGHRIPLELPQFLLSSDLDYPAFYHKLLSYFTRESLERREWLVSPIIEGLHAALVYSGAGWLLVQTGVYGEFPRGAALVIAAGWALTPLLTQDPTRGSYIGARPFGYLFGHAFMYFYVVHSFTRDTIAAVAAVLCCAVVMSASKFALQAIVFISLLYTALAWDAYSALLLLVSIVLSAAITGGYGLRVVRGSIRHSHFYASYLMRLHPATRAIRGKDLLVGLLHLLRGRIGDASRAIVRHPTYRFIAVTPWLWSGMLWIPLSEVSTPVTEAMINWTLATLLVATATSTDWLKFLGEAERYMEFTLLPLLVLSILLPHPLNWVLYGCLLAWCIWRQVAIYRPYRSFQGAAPATRSLLKWLAEHPTMTLLVIPGRLSFPITYHSSHRCVWWLANAPREPILSQWKKLFPHETIFPFIAPSALVNACVRYKVHAIVVDFRRVEVERRKWGLHYCLENQPVLYENRRYRVYAATCLQPRC